MDLLVEINIINIVIYSSGGWAEMTCDALMTVVHFDGPDFFQQLK
jgi:hypothetical protein